jgi:PKHD-type hydroxylase
MLTHKVKEAYHASFPYVFWDGFFTELELSTMLLYFDSLPRQAGLVGEQHENKLGRVDLETRKSDICFADFDSQNEWIFYRLFALADMINNHFFNYDLIGFDHLQYTVYDTEGSHYAYHMDLQENKDGTSVPRKLSFSVILSDRDEFEGGELEFLDGSTATQAEQKKGRVIAFPSYILHRVTPITKGIRKSLVFWVCGPKFR